MSRVPLLLLALCLSLYPCALPAQTTNGSITGRVTDPSKATIPDAKVAAVNAGTNFRYESATNGAGEYTLANLPPGTYQLEVEKSGFKKLIRPDVNLHVQDTLAIDFEMAVGSVSDTVRVEAGAPLVNTTSATVSTLVDQTFVENIPLNGRSFQTLIMLTPGVVITQTSFDDQGQFSVNGQRADANYFTVDGVSANFGVTGYAPLVQAAGGALPALSVLGGTNSLVSVDAMQEFRAQTSSFAPEFGRTPGGQISIVTRSGSNQFHGTAFEYFRNSVLDANDWFSNANHLSKPEERQNDFGGVFSGPVIKDKTFFFFSYEGLRLRQPLTQQTAVPDNTSRHQAPARIQPYLNAYPVANGAELGAGLAQFNGSYSDPSSLNTYSIRFDHAVNPHISLFGRYNYSPSDLTQRGPAASVARVLSQTERVSSAVHTFTLGLNQLITSQISNEVRANYSNQRISTKYVIDNFGGALPIPDSLLFPDGFSSNNGQYQFYVGGAGQYFQGKNATDEQRQLNFVDNLSVLKGAHQLRFGADYRWLAPFSTPYSYRQVAVFLGVTCPSAGSCAGYTPSSTVLIAGVLAYQSNALISQNFSLYGQDTWKVTPRLTFTYGVRWDVNPALKGKNSANDPFTVAGLNDPSTMTLAPRGTSLYQTTYGSVAPRIGVAYQLREGVLRGGFGTFYDLGSGSLGGVSSYFPYATQKSIPMAAFPLSPQNAAPPALTTNPPVFVILVADPHLKLPRTYEWNVTWEQSLGTSQTLSLVYVGAIGRDLLRVSNLYNPNPDFQQVNITDNTATSDYHALQVKFERRLSSGLQALASYTFSHSIDIASTDAAFSYVGTPSFITSSSIDRGNSDFDIRHSFTTGVTYSLPTPQWNRFARATLGGWSADTFVLARSAPPVNVVGSISFAGGTALASRPNVVPGNPFELFGPQYPGAKIFNKNAFKPAAPRMQGDFGRNVLRGFGATQADVALQRQFHLTEQVGLRFRAEFFNIFNHPNFGPPNNNLTSPLFGHSTQTLASSLGSGGANGGFNPLYQIGGPRSIQLALKLAF